MTKVIPFTPPNSNTGAQHTWKDGLNACVDWVQATFKIVQSPQELIENILLLDPNDFAEMDHGMFGYRSMLQCGHISVMYNGHEGMGIHMMMTGQGCREYENYGKLDWQTLFDIMLRCDGRFTRIDLAIDDFKGYFSIKQLIRKVKSGEMTSKFKNATRVEKIRIEDGKTVGETVYVGSDSSQVKVRFYDKLLEQQHKDGVDPADLEGINVWNRTEVQCRDDRAQAVAGLIALGEPAGKIAGGILKHYMRFTVRGKDRNKSRWKTAPFWQDFLDGVLPLQLAVGRPDVSIEKKVQWLKRQVAPTIAAVIQAYENAGIIVDLVEEGSERLKDRDLAIINEFKAKRKTVSEKNTETINGLK